MPAACPPHVRSSNGPGGVPVRPEIQGRQPGGVWKTTTRGGLLRRNGNKTKHRARPGRPAPFPTAAKAGGENACLLPTGGEQAGAPP